MDEDESRRDLAHQLGNTLQEKVALQYLLSQAANQIEELAELVSDAEIKGRAVKAAERFRRSAEL